MKQEEIISMARNAAQAPDRTDKSVLFFGLNGEQMFRFAALVAAAERKAIYDMVLFGTLKDPDLLMTETEVDDDAVDDYFRSSEFRYAMNNAVKATIFTITLNIRARGENVA